jgi:hypothetical protein
MAAPKLQILYRRNGDIFFGWVPLSKTEAKSYNLYSSATPSGVYSLVKSGIPNTVDKNYKNKVCALIKDSDIPIPANVRFYFKLTAVDPSNVESDINLSPYATIFPPTVDFHLEGDAQEANSHVFAWDENSQHWAKLLVTNDGKLKVDASIGDITLENVKVAARPDGTTIEYMLVDNNRRLVVSHDPSTYNRIRSYADSIIVAPNSETTVLTYMNASSYYLEKIQCTGTADALFKVKINGSTIGALRNSWNNRNVIFDFSDKSVQCPAGATITITAYHTETQNQSYDTGLFGYTYSY